MINQENDHRAKGGLNNLGFPLRKVIELKGNSHLLECGHLLERVSNASVRSRRCPECAGQKFPRSECPKINGNVRFTAIHNGENGAIKLAFYEKPETVGHIEQSVGQIEFVNWDKYREFITLQAVLVKRLDRQETERKATLFSNN